MPSGKPNESRNPERAKAPREKRVSKKASASNRFLHKWRWVVVVALFFSISIVVVCAWWVSLFNAGFHADDALRNLLVFQVGTTVENRFDPRLEVVLVSQSPATKDTSVITPAADAAAANAILEVPSGPINPAHRRYFASLLKTLADVHPKMVVFDVSFSKDAQDKEVDRSFAKAIEDLQKSGTEVIVGADLAEGEVVPIMAPNLEFTLKDHWAIWDGGFSKGSANVRFVRLGIEMPGQQEVDGERAIIPSLALEVVRHTLYPNKDVRAYFNPLTSEVSLREGSAEGPLLREFPVDKQLYFLVDMLGVDEMGRHPSLADFAEYLKTETYKRSLKDKVVIIGYEHGDEKTVAGSGSGKRFGADIQASAMSNLLQDSYIHSLSFLYHYLVILIMIVLGGVLRIKFCNLMNYRLPIKIPGFIDWKPQVPTVLIVLSLLYIFVAILAYRFERAIFSISYHLFALFLAYFLTSALCAKLGFK
ncbi:MAG: CHASE2 domain-containing protein [Acidobacteriota bacterium]|nr:CHASE2 domain-containing protein [Acidobacteriota bacterium]